MCWTFEIFFSMRSGSAGQHNKSMQSEVWIANVADTWLVGSLCASFG